MVRCHLFLHFSFCFIYYITRLISFYTYKLVIIRIIPKLFTISTIFYVSFWSSVGGNVLYQLNDMVNL